MFLVFFFFFALDDRQKLAVELAVGHVGYWPRCLQIQAKSTLWCEATLKACST